MKKILATVLAALMLVPFAACAQQESGDVVIGGLSPLTGAAALYGNAITNGALIAVDEINAAGGVLGRQIKFINYDEKGDPTEAINAYNKLVQTDKIVALMGDVTTAPTLAVAQKAVVDGIPMITPSATGAAVTETGENIFRICITDPFQGTLMADYAANVLGFEKVALLYDVGDDYTTGIADAFEAKAAELGMTITTKEGYPNKNTDYNAQLTKIKSGDPEAIMVCSYYEDAALIVTQARQLGIDIPMMGPDGWSDTLKQIGEDNASLLDGCYYLSQYSAADPGETLQKFMAAYEERYGEKETMFSVLGYEAVYALAKAIEAAGNTKSEDIVKALSNLTFDGLTGSISFAGGRDPVRAAYIVKYVGGAEVVLGTHNIQ